MPTFSAHRLREARESAGLTREQFAVRLGRSYPQIVQYEGGRAVPPTTVLTRLCEILNQPVGYFFEDGAA